MRIMRILAQVIDIAVGLGLLVGAFLLLPVLGGVLGPAGGAVLVLLLAIGVLVAVQLPFLRHGQTIGKAFFGLRVVSEDPARPLTASVLFQREVFCKLASCYLICLPVLAGRPGGHEVATATSVQRQGAALHLRRRATRRG